MISYLSPRVAWLLDRCIWSLAGLLVLFLARACWTRARVNQKLALGDGVNFACAERRSLLLPVHRARVV